MRQGLFNCAAALSLLASASVAVAQTQNQPCLSSGEMRGVAGFLLPSLHAAITESCASHLSPTGYLNTNRDRLAAKFVAGQDADWPVARAALLKLGAARSGQAIPDMPDEILRPLVEGGISSGMAARINASECGQIEQLAESIDPMPRANVVTLLAVAMPMIGSANNRIRSCPAG